MKNLQTFEVYPAIPETLSFLDILSKNLWWSWNHDAIDLFRRIDPVKWNLSKRNPVVFLSLISRRRFLELTVDDSFMGHLKRVEAKFSTRIETHPQEISLSLETGCTISYFSMEFGIHESLPIVAGGLGILAGDHLKSSSFADLPLTGVGLLFREGYFHQFLDHNGWQQESYPEIDLFSLPLKKAVDAIGNEVTVEVSSPLGLIRAQVWQVQVGRIRLLLLDANLGQNTQKIRDVTARLYAADADVRIAQEALLGIGGIRALVGLGLFPSVCHMNEGHCSFAGLERLSQVMKRYQVDLSTAREICIRSGVFTTHTPVAAGHDEFPPVLVKPYLEPFAAEFGVAVEELISWGQVPFHGPLSPFYMCVLGMHLSGFLNGVSRLHGQVARNMWTGLWPNHPVDEVPISHVTNGVHTMSYISNAKADLFDKYLAPDWEFNPLSDQLLDRIDSIENEDLWHIHSIDRSRLVRVCRKMLIQQYEARNAPRNVIESVSSVLNPNILTICFARRFATYKRADLLFKDLDRLEAIISSETMPVQFVFAGKAHPNDKDGKEIIQKIIRFSNRYDVRHRMVFLEDYDINIARYMVQGADIWLNTPRRPLEACGTSGMKSALNGGLNLSILDGWWCEGYSPERGWSIGNGKTFNDNDYQDMVECQSLYNLLENEVIPCFYERKRGNPPDRWIAMMKASMKMAIQRFSSHRMINEYINRFYLPAAMNIKRLTADNAWVGKETAARRSHLKNAWERIWVGRPKLVSEDVFYVGDTFRLTTTVFLGDLVPQDVEVQLYYGKLKSPETIEGGRVEVMTPQQDFGDGSYTYTCSLTCSDPGRFGYTVRVVPEGDEILKKSPGFMTWADQPHR